MHKIILIHANCHHATALGDFVFAGNLAKELKMELRAGDIDVCLVSPADGMPRYQRLYGSPVDGRVDIDGISIAVSSLEDFDPVMNHVVAFIDANRCKHSPAEIIKRVVAPDTRFIFIGNMNQAAITDPFSEYDYKQFIKSQQPGLYEAFDSRDFLIGAAGLGPDRFGIPRIFATAELPPLAERDRSKLAKSSYGFMYLAAINPDTDYALMAQYMKLTNIDHHVLVGNFATAKDKINFAYMSEMWMDPSEDMPKLPEIEFYESLDNPLMRRMVANTSTTMVISTGITSTLEAMRDQKLCFYQNMATNRHFISSYLSAVQAIANTSLPAATIMAQQIIELSALLFAPKPLTVIELKRTAELMRAPKVSSKLIKFNQTILDQASGKIAPRLLGFLSSGRDAENPMQLKQVIFSLRKSGETTNPSHDQALRRAAAWGRLLEIKVLLKSLPTTEQYKTDATSGMCAFHFAVKYKSLDCVRELIKAGFDLNFPATTGKTALHWAMQNMDKVMIKFLIDHGAKMPEDYRTHPDLHLFIDTCYAAKASESILSRSLSG